MAIDDDRPARPIPNEPPDVPPPASANGSRRAVEPITPHDAAIEAGLLGIALLNPAAGAPEVAALSPDRHFYLPAHTLVAGAIQDLHDQGEPIDAHLVSHHLASQHLLEKAGGASRIVELLSNAPMSTVAPAYAQRLRDLGVARAIHAKADAAARAARNGDTAEALAYLAELDQEDIGAGATIAWDDVGAVIRGEVEGIRPEILRRNDGQALIYPGLLHWLMGEPGKGKTWVALHATAEQLLAGRVVIYLDWEGNRLIVGERLRGLGVPADVVDQHLRYLRPPHVTADLIRGIAHVASADRVSLVVLDGAAKAMARQGLNEDKAPDVLAWLELVATPLTEAGAAVLVLDHVTKDKEDRGLWARGNGAKIGEVSGAAWMVRPREGFSRHKGGRIDLVQAKDREGHVGSDGDTVAQIHVMPGDDGAITITVKAPPAAGDPDTFRPTGLMEKVSRALEQLETEGIHPSQNQVCNVVPSTRRQHVIRALQVLIEEGHVTRRPGRGNGHAHQIVNPYRELDDPNSDRYRPAEDDHEQDDRERF